MARYVALFGSINVGGNRLTMADLRAAFEAEGFSDVETVVASGNVIFSHPARPTRGDRALYIDYGEGVADSKLTARLIERRLEHKGTARNMRSIARIVDKLDQLEKAEP